MASYNPRRKPNIFGDVKKPPRNGYNRTNSSSTLPRQMDHTTLRKGFSSLLNINNPVHYQMSSAKSIADISCDSTRSSSFVKIMQSVSSPKSASVYSSKPIKKHKLQDDEKFDTKAAEVIAERLLDKKLKSLKDVDYDPLICKRYAQSLSLDVAKQLDQINFPHYRRVVIIHIGRAHDFKDIFFSSRCIWSASTDRSVSIHRCLENLFGIVQIFAVL